MWTVVEVPGINWELYFSSSCSPIALVPACAAMLAWSSGPEQHVGCWKVLVLLHHHEIPLGVPLVFEL
eukprot:m51a1_g9906 hypothetical protein (68) ;mRNA; f:89199-89740